VSSESRKSLPLTGKLGVGVGVGVVAGVGVGDGDGVGVGGGVGDVAGCTFGATGASETPLFQTNFLPDLTQVNFLVLVRLMLPIFLQELPALTAECAGKTHRQAMRVVAMIRGRRLPMARE